MNELVSARPMNRRRWMRSLTSVAAALAIAGSAAAVGISQMAASASTVRASALQNVQIVLSIPGITDVGQPKGQGAIEILSWSWGVSNGSTTTAGGGRAGRPAFDEIVITKTQDKSSPLFFQSCASGTHYKTATLAIRSNTGGAGTSDSAVIVLSNVLISSVQNAGSGGDNPTESVTLNFTKITYNYTTGADGSVTHMGWDLATNKKI